MKNLLKISRALIKSSQVGFQDTIKATSKAQSKNIDSSTKLEGVDLTYKPEKQKIYPVENPVSKLVPGGINVY